MRENYEILGLSENATDEELAAQYQELIAKYKEERWLDGEAGNEAARMLTKVETAYQEIMAARKEQKTTTSTPDAFEEISELLKQNKVTLNYIKLLQKKPH